MSLSPSGAPKITEIAQAGDPKAAILKAVGDLRHYEVLSDLVLVGTFIRNEKIRGLIRLDVAEDEHQGKVGLVLKTGAYAYGDWEPEARRGDNAVPGTWVVFQGKDAWPLQINGAPVRLVPYQRLRMRVADPYKIY